MFWRDKNFNRRDDDLAIKLIKEARQAGSSLDRDKWIRIFLLTKRDEGVLCTADVTDPKKLDDLIGPSSKTNWMAYEGVDFRKSTARALKVCRTIRIT